MIKSKFVRTLILSVCLTAVSTGGVYATTGDSLDTPVSSPAQITPIENKDVLEKQREIDKYVFEQHKDEIAQKGFKVTHTGPMGDFVEIGIEPIHELKRLKEIED